MKTARFNYFPVAASVLLFLSAGAQSAALNSQPEIEIKYPSMNERIPTFAAKPSWGDAIWAMGTVGTNSIGISNVMIQLNNGSWISTFVVSNQWSRQVYPSIGTNVLNAYAIDNEGNQSATNSVTFVLLPIGGVGFSQTRGIYSGLFTNVNGADQPGSGFFYAAVNSRGYCTAHFSLEDLVYSISGRFSADGLWHLDFGPKSNRMSVDLQMDMTGGDQMRGTLVSSNLSASLVACRDVYSTANRPAQAGKTYTVVLGASGEPSEPGGYGYGVVRVNASGYVTFSGALGDGTSVLPAATLSKEGRWPVFVPLYHGKGAIMGWLNFTNAPNRDIEGVLTWTKPARSKDKFYKDGFTNQIEAAGSALVAGAGQKVLTFTNGVVVLEGGNLPESQANQFVLKPNNTASGSGISLSISRINGLFSGTVTPTHGKSVKVRGAVLQKQNTAYGLFTGTNQTGQVMIAGGKD